MLKFVVRILRKVHTVWRALMDSSNIPSELYKVQSEPVERFARSAQNAYVANADIKRLRPVSVTAHKQDVKANQWEHEYPCLHLVDRETNDSYRVEFHRGPEETDDEGAAGLRAKKTATSNKLSSIASDEIR
ncbi:hypothetical protein C0991_000496, partial [Blastosporella zonata]